METKIETKINWSFFEVPKVVGRFVLPVGMNCKINLTKKPSWWFRFWVKVFFNTRWEDGEF